MKEQQVYCEGSKHQRTLPVCVGCYHCRDCYPYQHPISSLIPNLNHSSTVVRKHNCHYLQCWLHSANHLLGDARLAPTGEGCYPTTPLPKLNHSSTVVPKPNCRYLQSWPYNAGLDRWHCEADFTRPTQGEPPIGPQKGANLPGYTFRKKGPPQRTLTSGRSREPTLKPPRYGHT